MEESKAKIHDMTEDAFNKNNADSDGTMTSE